MRSGQLEPPGSIDEYIAGFPPDDRQILEQIRNAIRATAPDAMETIKYRIPTFVLPREPCALRCVL